MVADRNNARRPALPRTRRRLLALLLSAPLVLFPALAVGQSATAAPAPVATAATNTVSMATDDDSVTLSLSPSASSILHINEDLRLSVSVTNDSASPLSSATVEVYLAERALTTRTALNDWLDPDDDRDSGELMLSVPLTAPVQPHSTVSLDVTVPNASLGLFEWSPWGPRGIAATLSTDDTVRAAGQSTFVWYPDTSTTQVPTVTPVNLAVAMPITTPAGSTGIIGSDDLAAYTASSGILTRQLDGVINKPVAIAIDPMIIASIRLLGSAAPPTAVDWLARLDQAENDIFPLGYADADPSLAVQAGASGVPVPLSLNFALDPNLFAATDQVTPPAGQSEATDPATPAPTATPESPTSTVPTLEQLLAWDYTSTTIAWPADNVVAQDDLAAFAAAGLSTTILAAGNVTQSDEDATASTTTALGSDELGLVADAGISTALRTAATATTDDAWRAAMAEVSSQIAVVAAANPAAARTLLATIDRGWPPTAARLAQTIQALNELPWYAPTTLTTATATPVSTSVSFAAQAEPTGTVDLAARLIDRETELNDFSTALADPVAVTAPNRLALLALLAPAWQSDTTAWRTAVGDNLAASHEVLRSITVTTTGPINVVGSKVDIPITLNNALGQAVTVRVQVVPSNGRLVVGNDVEAVLDASSAKTVSIPVTAAVGNGAVTLRVSLFTPSGAAIDQPSLISVNVRADWEGIGSRIFAALVVLFFGFGVWRNIVHRRRDRALAARTEADPHAESGADPAPSASAEPTTEPDDLPTAPRG
ncbi:DUF6049 family protein [Cryobacterium arcticum]|uniref:2-oxoglutarate dehydrogenase n=1 Tax=Cryobacterium arcticum TaxID=670052 RepID=A0A1B1BQ07_9MICO|nr:DUF6049 family protein [Cryobacterium arcticum]ANP74732.1 hypothetical protein PA27867_3817 [Cryobacterium arcticum]